MKHFKHLTLGSILGLAVMASGALVTPAHAVTIDFEGLANSGGAGATVVGNPYMEDGFNISADTGTSGGSDRLVSWHTDNAGGFAGSTGLFANNLSAVVTLVEGTGAAFSLRSIQLADVLGITTTPPLVTFIANLVGGGTTSQSFTPSMGLSFESFLFDNSFGNITSVSWTQGAAFPDGHQFDNIEVGNPIPEPTTILLLGSTLAGLMAWRYRKSKKSA